jgi:NAD(P)-dependent dehydrogenase (short-subunit alcohol dehydrogenase family)
VTERDPREGPTPDESVETQRPPGVEAGLEPEADHGEESYRGSGKLEGQVAIITGGDSGIGRAVAIALAREGADVAIGYEAEKEEEDARDTGRWIEKAGRRAFLRRFDVGDQQQAGSFVDDAVAELGRLDILVNNAAYQMTRESFEEISPSEIDHTFRTNIFGYIYMAQAALPHMKAGGVIINTGSITAMEGHPELIDYACTKGAIHAFTKSLAGRLGDRGIRVNCVAPGPVWTPLIPATMPEEKVESFGEDTVWGRPAQPAEIAPSYVFLASSDSLYYTGEILAPTGRSTSR